MRLIFANVGAPTVVFQREQGREETELRFYPAQPVVLTHETGISSLEPATFLELRGASITEAFAYRKGDPESWKLTHPRPGQPIGGCLANYFSVEGYAGDTLLIGE